LGKTRENLGVYNKAGKCGYKGAKWERAYALGKLFRHRNVSIGRRTHNLELEKWLVIAVEWRTGFSGLETHNFTPSNRNAGTRESGVSVVTLEQ